MSVTPTSTPTTLPPSLAKVFSAFLEWLAGELTRSPVALKLAGLGAVVAGAVPGDIGNTVVRAVLVAVGGLLTAAVHLAEAKKA